MAMRRPPNEEAAFERRWNRNVNPAAEPRRYPDAADLLFARGADPNSASDDGTTALHVAVSVDNDELVRPLIAHGANPNPKPSAGWKGARSPLLIAVTRGNATVVRALLAAAADPRAEDAGGRILLAQAAARHEGLVAMLTAAGADVTARPNECRLGGNASGVAATSARPDAVAALIDAGVTDPTLLGGALVAAVSTRDMKSAGVRLQIVRRLLATGAPVNFPSDSGMAVKIAGTNGYHAIVRLLKSQGGKYDETKSRAAEAEMRSARHAVP